MEVHDLLPRCIWRGGGMRGGFVGVQVSALVTGDAWPDLTNAALGAWVRIRATSELSGDPVTPRQADRISSEPERAELLSAGLLEVDGAGSFRAVGMPDYLKPSDAPEQQRLRRAASRAGVSAAEYRAQNSNSPTPPVSQEEIKRKSSQGTALSRVTPRDLPTMTPPIEDTDREHDLAYLSANKLCRRCREPGTEHRPLFQGRHRFADDCRVARVEAMA
jgi:hypothetical protein